MSTVDAIEAALAGLEARGAREFDRAGCDFIRKLLERSDGLGPVGTERLLSRATQYLSALETRFEQAKARAQANLLRAQQSGRLSSDHPARWLERGEIERVERAVRRSERVRAPASRATSVVVAEARPEAQSSSTSQWRRRTEDLYEDSVADLVASFALARASDVVPKDSGPYNPLRIASDAMRHMRELSPLYLRTQLHRLEELASLMALPPIEAERGPAAARAKKGKKRRG